MGEGRGVFILKSELTHGSATDMLIIKLLCAKTRWGRYTGVPTFCFPERFILHNQNTQVTPLSFKKVKSEFPPQLFAASQIQYNVSIDMVMFLTGGKKPHD